MVAFSTGCKRLDPFHDPTREAGKRARRAPYLLGLFQDSSGVSSGPPLLLWMRSSAPPPLSVTWKHTAALWSMCVLIVGVFPSCVRPPSIDHYYSIPTAKWCWGGGAHTKHVSFFIRLMRSRRKRGLLQKDVSQKVREIPKEKKSWDLCGDI